MTISQIRPRDFLEIREFFHRVAIDVKNSRSDLTTKSGVYETVEPSNSTDGSKSLNVEVKIIGGTFVES